MVARRGTPDAVVRGMSPLALPPRTPLERLGFLGGFALAPLAALLAFVRGARALHPHGVVFRARVAPMPVADADLDRVGQALAGTALARFSGALWRHEAFLPDVLGLAIRFTDPSAPVCARALPDDQDVLFATLSSPWALGVAPFATDVTSFLANDYFALAAFEAGSLELPIELRVRSPRIANPARKMRALHLAEVAEQGAAVLAIEARHRRPPFQRSPWVPIARLVLDEPARVNQRALQLSPFRTGRGLRPTGFLTQLRRAPYVASTWARPEAGDAREHYLGVGGPSWLERSPSSRAPEY